MQLNTVRHSLTMSLAHRISLCCTRGCMPSARWWSLTAICSTCTIRASTTAAAGPAVCRLARTVTHGPQRPALGHRPPSPHGFSRWPLPPLPSPSLPASRSAWLHPSMCPPSPTPSLSAPPPPPPTFCPLRTCTHPSLFPSPHPSLLPCVPPRLAK